MLRMHVGEYVRPPRCKRCPSRKLRYDKYRGKIERKARACTDAPCGYWFPHRRGSKWCVHAKTRPDEAEQEEWFRGFAHAAVRRR